MSGMVRYVLIGSVILTFGCADKGRKKDETNPMEPVQLEPSTEPSALFPLKDGASWEMVGSIYEFAGKPERPLRWRFSVTGPVVKNGLSCYRVQRTEDKDGFPDEIEVEYVIVTISGYHLVAVEYPTSEKWVTELYNPPPCILNTRLKAEASWTTETKYLSTFIATSEPTTAFYSVEQAPEKVQVMGTELDAIRVQREDRDRTLETWYAVGSGPVRCRTTLRDGLPFKDVVMTPLPPRK